MVSSGVYCEWHEMENLRAYITGGPRQGKQGILWGEKSGNLEKIGEIRELITRVPNVGSVNEVRMLLAN